MKHATRRRLLEIGLLLPLTSKAARPRFPSKPILLIVAFPAGNSTDAAARHVAQEMSDLLGQTFVVENRSGAQGVLGTQFTQRAAPDGYTLVLVSNGSHAASSALFAKPPFDPVKDFTPIGTIASSPSALVIRRGLPAVDLAQFVRHANVARGQISIGHASASAQACAALLETAAAIDLNDVPYRAVQQATLDMEGGRLDAAMIPLGPALRERQQGKLRVLAVAAPTRSPLAPDIPTFAELNYPAVQLVGWLGILGPAGLPADIQTRLAAALLQVLERPATKEKFAFLGQDVMITRPTAFRQLIADDVVRWKKLQKLANIPLQ